MLPIPHHTTTKHNKLAHSFNIEFLYLWYDIYICTVSISIYNYDKLNQGRFIYNEYMAGNCTMEHFIYKAD